MNEKPDANAQDDDYQFEDFDKFEMSDEASVNTASPEVEPDRDALKPYETKKDHRKMIGIGVVLVIILGFGLNSLVNRMSSVKIAKEKVVPKPVSETVEHAPMSTAVPANPMLAAPAVVVPDATSSEIDRLNDVLVAQQQTMDQMQTSINALQQTVNGFNGTLSDISQKVTDGLTKIATKAPVRPKVQSLQMAEPARPIYTIRALVPGRAWLQSNDGQSITVINGDQVPGYGAVQDIDLNAGQVILSDGTVVGYNYDS